MDLSSLSNLAKQLHAKQFSSEELTHYCLEKIKIINPSLNCYITDCEEQALAAAKQADQALTNNNATSLTGIPIAIKDIFCTKNIKTTCASKMLEHFIPPYDATAIQKLKKSGAIIVGKTNMDEFAMGSSNENSYFGVVKNPWDKNRVAGGSSGGSAAAVASKTVPVALGTDTGGSVRQPAAFCGLSGIKPSYGRVSRYGMIAFASSLDQAGIMANNAEDLAITLTTIAGYDPMDATSSQQNIPNYNSALNQPINNLTIGIPTEYFTNELDPTIANHIDQAMHELKKLGINFKAVSLPNTQLAIPTYYIIAPAECSSNLSRYDGVKFGYRCKDPKNLEDLYERTRSEGFGDEVKRRIMIGTYALSTGYYDDYYLKALKARNLITQDFQQAFAEVDAIISPTTPEVAFKLGEKNANPITMYLSDIYTVAVNLAGLPAISIPCGFKNKLPIGVQLIGKAFDEATLLNVAHQYQKVTDWHLQTPEST